MSEFVRQKLVELVAKVGPEICTDARRCEALLCDLCKNQNKREIFVIVGAIRERIPPDFGQSTTDVPKDVLLNRLTDRLTNNLGLAQRIARWGVESWGLALGALQPSDLAQHSSAAEFDLSNPFEESTSLDAVEMLRRAVRKALKDGIITDDEKNELHILRRTLGISPEVAGHVFAEERSRPASDAELNQRDGKGVPQSPLVPWGRTHWRQIVLGFLVLWGGVLVSVFWGDLFSTTAKTESASHTPLQLFAARQATVHRDMTVGSESMGQVQRGDLVQGDWVSTGTDGSKWLRLSAGQLSGGFVLGADLAASPPPELIRSIGKELTVQLASELKRTPSTLAENLQPLSPGQRVRVAGVVEGGWLEILREAGGVGYAPQSTFETNAVSGTPTLMDTATLRIDGQRIQLAGLAGNLGESLSKMKKFIIEQGGYLRCTQDIDDNKYRCFTSTGIDLGAAALLNGAARTSDDASMEYQHYEAQAREERRGIWQ